MPDKTVFTVNTAPGQMGIVGLQSSFVNLGEDKKASIDAPLVSFPVICRQECYPPSLAISPKLKRLRVVLKTKAEGKKVRWSEVLQTATSAVRAVTTNITSHPRSHYMRMPFRQRPTAHARLDSITAKSVTVI
jgi:hypothetical protein